MDIVKGRGFHSRRGYEYLFEMFNGVKPKHNLVTPLMVAVMWGILEGRMYGSTNQKIIQFLLNNGARVDYKYTGIGADGRFDRNGITFSVLESLQKNLNRMSYNRRPGPRTTIDRLNVYNSFYYSQSRLRRPPGLKLSGEILTEASRIRSLLSSYKKRQDSDLYGSDFTALIELECNKK